MTASRYAAWFSSPGTAVAPSPLLRAGTKSRAVGLTGPTRRAAQKRPKNGGARIPGLNVWGTGATGGKTLRLLDRREQLQASALAASSEGTVFDFWRLFGNRVTEPSDYNGRLYPTS